MFGREQDERAPFGLPKALPALPVCRATSPYRGCRMMILAVTSSSLGLLASGPLPPPTPPRSALAFGSRRAAAIRAESATGGTFVATIELGEGDGTVVHEFDPYFSSSTLITMRYPVPYTLEASPLQGVIKVTDSGDGLIEGDVLRAFSTLQLRCDAAADPASSL